MYTNFTFVDLSSEKELFRLEVLRRSAQKSKGVIFPFGMRRINHNNLKLIEQEYGIRKDHLENKFSV